VAAIFTEGHEIDAECEFVEAPKLAPIMMTPPSILALLRVTALLTAV
jgi:hypothetical protein